MVGHNAVDLLRIVQTACSETRLHMADRDMQLYRRQGRRHGGVGIAKDQQHIRRLLLQNGFNLHQHLTGHLPMAPAGNSQVVIRLRDPHLLKKDIGHIAVVVLSRMNQDLLAIFAQFPRDHRQFDELRTRADNGTDFFRHTHLPRIPFVNLVLHTLY